MPRIILLIAITMACILPSFGQNVGIGNTSPLEKMHLNGGNFRVDDGFSVQVSTYPGDTAGVRFLLNKILRGGLVYHANDNMVNLTSNDTIHGMTYNFNSNKMFLGRDFGLTGAETFGVSTHTQSWGGMYMETYGGPNGRPFYGYGIDSVGKAYHYYDGASTEWRLALNNVTRLSVDGTSGDIAMDATTLFVDAASNRVGIGTSTPQSSLHVGGIVRIDNPTAQLGFFSGSDFNGFIQTSGGAMTVSNKGPANLNLMTNDFVRMSIQNNGNIGIGTITPLSKLHVAGVMRIDNFNPELGFYNGGVFMGNILANGTDMSIKNTGTGNLNLITNNVPRMSVGWNGSVGIGTTSPASDLHVMGAMRIEHSTPQLLFYEGGSFKGLVQTSGNDLSINNKGSGNLNLMTSDAVRLSIATSGNVGIGTSTPNAKMHVSGGSIRVTDSNPYLDFYLGATPHGRFSANGTHLSISKPGSTGNITFANNGQVRMVIDPDGNVGIGTLTPLLPLHVKGVAAIEGVGQAELRLIHGVTTVGGIFATDPDLVINNQRFAGSRILLKTGSVDRMILNNTGLVEVPGEMEISGDLDVDNNTLFVHSGLGRVGIGTQGPSATLDVAGSLEVDGNTLKVDNVNNRVLIGTNIGATGYKLSVDGKIASEEVLVQMSGAWPDYVFESGYKLRSVSELRQYIKDEGHLPGVPSVSDVDKKNGIEVGEMNRVLLEKVEELTLYIIEQDERIARLEMQLREDNH